MPSIPLKAGTFSDSGYRFRENVFEKQDSYIPFWGRNEESFYDMIFYNSDQVSVGKDFMSIAEMYFRIDTSVI